MLFDASARAALTPLADWLRTRARVRWISLDDIWSVDDAVAVGVGKVAPPGPGQAVRVGGLVLVDPVGTPPSSVPVLGLVGPAATPILGRSGWCVVVYPGGPLGPAAPAVAGQIMLDFADRGLAAAAPTPGQAPGAAAWAP